MSFRAGEARERCRVGVKKQSGSKLASDGKMTALYFYTFLKYYHNLKQI